MKELIPEIRELLQEERIPRDAVSMQQYMKNKFPFMGVKSPARTTVFRKIWPAIKPVSLTDQFAIVEYLWNEEEREFQYLGLDLLKRVYRKLEIDYLEKVEKLILEKSWWDTVDMLAVRPMGHLLFHHPALPYPKSLEWIESGNLWLQRTALLFQLSYKEYTDRKLLEDNILRLAGHSDFFIRKGAGWALRELSKTDPDWVRNFLERNSQLSKLTIREGSKYV